MEEIEEDETRVLEVVYGGRWRIVGRLGAGGMGTVFSGVDVDTGQRVAIKTLGVHLVDNPEFVKRFEREAKLLERLKHPALPAFLGIGRHGPMPYFVMSLVEGKTARALLSDKQRVPPARALALLDQLANVLAYLHDSGVVHRDLKPENLILDEHDNVFVVDFGISTQTGVTRLTLPGVAVGTPLYMAPEAITSDAPTAVSDVYSMGLLAYAMLCGEHPFARDDRAGMMTRQVTEVPRPARVVNPELPEAVSLVLSRALEKNPQLRFQTAPDFAAALRRAFAPARSPHDEVTENERPAVDLDAVRALGAPKEEVTVNERRVPQLETAQAPAVMEDGRPPTPVEGLETALKTPVVVEADRQTTMEQPAPPSSPAVFVAVVMAALVLGSLAVAFALR